MIFKHEFEIDPTMQANERFMEHKMSTGAADLGRKMLEYNHYQKVANSDNRYKLVLFATSAEKYHEFQKQMKGYLNALELLPDLKPIVGAMRTELQKFELGE